MSIPSQDNFKATGTSQQIIGNLESGDYTIVSFDVSSIASMPNRAMNKSIPSTPPSVEAKSLKIKLDYTDGIGERRSVIKEVEVSNSGSSGNFTGNFSARRTGTTTTSNYIWWYIIGGIIIVLAIAAFVYKKYFYKKGKGKNSGKIIPDWVLAEKSNHKK